MLCFIVFMIFSQNANASGDPSIVFLSASIFLYQLIVLVSFFKIFRKGGFKNNAVFYTLYFFVGTFLWHQYLSSYSDQILDTIILIIYPILFLIYAGISGREKHSDVG